MDHLSAVQSPFHLNWELHFRGRIQVGGCVLLQQCCHGNTNLEVVRGNDITLVLKV